METIEALTNFYSNYDEEGRLLSRHGQVEYLTTMRYIEKYLQPGMRILEIGAATGRYSHSLARKGYQVDAVELIQHNIDIFHSLTQPGEDVTIRKGNAVDLSCFSDGTYDMTLLLGPMYHLFGFDDKLKALLEAKRVTKPGGIILVAYCMNEYSVITYAFKERHVMECMEQGRFSNTFQTLSLPEHLYDYMRIEDIDTLNESARLTRIKIISPDGAANYIRPFLNQLTDEEFEMFIQYHMSTCERMDLIGAGAHTLDILQK